LSTGFPAAGSAAGTDAFSTNVRHPLSAAMSAENSADVMARLDIGPIAPQLRTTVSGDSATPEQKLYLWCPLAEALEPSDADFAAEVLEALPGEVFPLLRLCILHRLRHRWQGSLTEPQEARLAALIAAAEKDLEAHFLLFADTPGAEPPLP
jgi:hypothetical protein